MQLHKLKLGIKTCTEVTLNPSLNMTIFNSNDENNFPHKLLLIARQVSRL